MTNHICPAIFCCTHWQAAMKRLFASVLLLLLLQATGHTAPLILKGRIVWVADGDTVTLLDERKTLHKIRLAGIDAPETAMPYGRQATLHLASLVLGKHVDAATYKQDRYGRTVATLLLGAQDINLAMIQAGLAWHYKRYAKEQPAAEAQAYAQAEVLAQTNNLALWQDSDPCTPWDWRKSRRVRPSQAVGANFTNHMSEEKIEKLKTSAGETV
jgi:endonuclease YncB( thermonuclease family)